MYKECYPKNSWWTLAPLWAPHQPFFVSCASITLRWKSNRFWWPWWRGRRWEVANGKFCAEKWRNDTVAAARGCWRCSAVHAMLHLITGHPWHSVKKCFIQGWGHAHCCSSNKPNTSMALEKHWPMNILCAATVQVLLLSRPSLFHAFTIYSCQYCACL